MGFDEYVHYWKEHLTEIKEYDKTRLGAKFKQLKADGLLSDHNVEKQDFDRLKRFTKFGVRPGVALTFECPTFGAKLHEPASFARKVKAKIDEALPTWGDSFA